ncbi:group 1 glycosyltransferase [Gracilibacillus halophilus YIM-C55.5]|uniref:Group 1 glycosyltransferase n=1 Tax=Gracilibacillus halophilus YIM-C55.5 TaxID=1308866 RepID=N4WC28_9BACI|nr:glycosyltransferase family 1 protein [Gracilibacillus halophilus]ENH96809.1 group 1 glycosyltransferase [Gracilibacillus halophilus YIM-C55.5]
MKIALFTDTYTPEVNGVAQTLSQLTRYLDASDHQYIVITPKFAMGRSKHEPPIYPQSSFPFPLYRDCRLSLPSMRKIRQLLHNFQPDIIHIATPFTIGITGLFYAKRFDIPMIASYHTNFDQYLSYYHLSWLSKPIWRYMEWFHQSMEKIFVPSESTWEELSQHQFHHLKIWKRGIDQSIFYPNDHKQPIRNKYQIKEKFVLCYAGRLAPEKNTTILAYLFQNIPTEWQEDIHWLIAGDGPDMPLLKKHAPPHATFTGFLPHDQLAEVYSVSDLMIFPSETETFGNVVLEALACGTPVIGANAGGVKHLIQHRLTGILCSKGKPTEYVRAIIELFHHPEWLSQLSDRSVRYTELLGWQHRCEELLTAYQEVIEKKRLLHA